MFLILSKGFLKRSHNMHTDMTRISTFYTFFLSSHSFSRQKKTQKTMAGDLCVCFFLFSYAKYRYDPISSVLSRYSLYHPVVKLYRIFKGGGLDLDLHQSTLQSSF